MATATQQLSEVTPEVLQSQLKGLSHERTRAGAVATLLLLLPRLDDAHAPLLLPYVPTLARLLEDGEGQDETVPVRRRGRAGRGGPGAWRRCGRCWGGRPGSMRHGILTPGANQDHGAT
jgi:hypothetical protein